MSAAGFSSSESAALERLSDVSGQVVKTPRDLLEAKYDLKECVKWVKMHALWKVCLQFPDSILPDSVEIALYLEKRLNMKFYILGDTSYGSCCVDEVAAQHIAADGILHFGHACLNPTAGTLPVFHVLPKAEVDTAAFCREFERYFKDTQKKIILFYDVTYTHAIDPIYDSLRTSFSCLEKTKLHCDSSYTSVAPHTDEEDVCFLGREFPYGTEEYEAIFLGPNGKTLSNFAMGIPFRAWHYYDGGIIREFTAETSPWLKRRKFLVEKLKDARIVGIVVATLGIKDYLQAVASVKSILKAKNKKSYILSVGKPNPAKLANFPEIDAFVVIACPENNIYDSRDFFKPILTPFEVELAFNSAREFSTRYCMDFRHILPGRPNYVPFESSSESDVSLISGTIRNLTEDESLTEEMKALVSRADGTVAIGKGGASYLAGRSWQGLDQRLGQDSVKAVEKGRSGLAAGYQNEPV